MTPEEKYKAVKNENNKLIAVYQDEISKLDELIRNIEADTEKYRKERDEYLLLQLPPDGFTMYRPVKQVANRAPVPHTETFDRAGAIDIVREFLFQSMRFEYDTTDFQYENGVITFTTNFLRGYDEADIKYWIEGVE